MNARVLPADPVRDAATKVPEITAMFWVIKVLTTGVGETASDFLFQHLAPLIVIPIGLVGLVAALVAQLRARRYVPWIYWTAVGAVSVVGTMVADVIHVGLGVPYSTLTIVSALVVAGLFAAWHTVERTLSVHTISTRRREAFYWATVLATFALGTAAGDLTAKTLHLGVPGLPGDLRGGHRPARGRAPHRRPERGGGLLVRLRRDAAARRLLRRLVRGPGR